MNLAVALGVAAATAVLTGALIVGESVRGSLRYLAFDRLGRIDEVLVTDRFFRDSLAKELAAEPDFQTHFSEAVPAILFPRATVETQRAERVSRATGVFVIGGDEAFWNLGDPAARPDRLPGADEIALNATLAAEIGAKIGDSLLVRLPKASEVPADSPLGEKTDRIRTIVGLRVVAIVPDKSLGRFSLSTSQITPRIAYVAPTTIQDALSRPGRVNALLVAGNGGYEKSAVTAHEKLAAALRPRLEDFGIRIDRVRRTFRPPGGQSDEVIFDYFHVTTNRMLFEPAAAEAVQRALARADVQPVSTYVANSIAKRDGGDSPEIPYSVVSGIDSKLPLGPLVNESGQPISPLNDDEIVLNSWAAGDLQANVGDRIRLRFYQPEATHGKLDEDSAEFTLRAIVPLTEPASPYSRRREAVYDQRPTLVNDPDLTPEVEGVTDKDSIDDWEAPFPVDYSRVRAQDDDYWQNHRTTPKAFVSLAAAQTLWGSRFGCMTSFRVPAPEDLPMGESGEAAYLDQLRGHLTRELDTVKDRLGFDFQPIRQHSQAAAAGTTPFDVLFLALSFFVILAALILVLLLFRLAVEQRASEVGTLLAVGFRRWRAAGALIAEGTLVAAAGGVLGIAAGTGYAWLMITGLRTWWVGAITSPFLQMFVTPLSLLGGYMSGVLVCIVTIGLSLRFMRRTAVRSLLAGRVSEELAIAYRQRRWWWIVSLVLLAVSLGLAVTAARSGGETQAASFVGAGAAVLAALLIAIRGYLKAGGLSSMGGAGLSLQSLAARNAARNPTRSAMTVGLMAVASFLIIAMGAFRSEPTDKGTGGFALVAESDQPIFEDLNSAEGRGLLLGDRAESLQGSFVAGLRVQSGDDAACTNLYRPSQPRVLGVTLAMIRHFDAPGSPSFGWSASAAETPEEKANPWRTLESGRTDDGTVPVIMDMNTAMYSLQLYRGIGEEFEVLYDQQEPIRFRVVGLLSTCILQGSLLIHEEDFLQHFPDVAGYRMFLIETQPGQEDAVASAMEDRLSDQGFDVRSATDRLNDLLAVQNTYLSTFQTLGALGLLLGTFGLATVQVRNVVERRSEFALMRAAGFRRGRLAAMVLDENIALLLGGLLSGFLAAMVAIVPYVVLGGASVPLRELSLMLGVVLLVGVLSSLASVRSTLRAPLLPALRGE